MSLICAYSYISWNFTRIKTKYFTCPRVCPQTFRTVAAIIGDVNNDVVRVFLAVEQLELYVQLAVFPKHDVAVICDGFDVKSELRVTKVVVPALLVVLNLQKVVLQY